MAPGVNAGRSHQYGSQQQQGPLITNMASVSSTVHECPHGTQASSQPGAAGLWWHHGPRWSFEEAQCRKGTIPHLRPPSLLSQEDPAAHHPAQPYSAMCPAIDHSPLSCPSLSIRPHFRLFSLSHLSITYLSIIAAPTLRPGRLLPPIPGSLFLKLSL